MTFLQMASLTGYGYGIGSTSPGGDVISFTVGKTGQYFIATKMHHSDGSNTQWMYYELRKNGGVLDAFMARARFSGVEEYTGGLWQGHCNAGDTITVNASNGGFNIADGSCYAYFIPTPAERI